MLSFRVVFRVLVLSALIYVSYVCKLYASTLNEDEFINTIKSRNVELLVKKLNDIKGSRYHNDLLPIINAIWEKNKTILKHVSWDFLDLDIIRINVADILVQDYQNGIIVVA